MVICADDERLGKKIRKRNVSMCRGYELLTGENCLAAIARSNQMGNSYQTELQTRFCWITERIIMNALLQ